MKKSKLVLIGSLVAVAVGVLFTISAIGIDKEGEYKKGKFSFLQEKFGGSIQNAVKAGSVASALFGRPRVSIIWT